MEAFVFRSPEMRAPSESKHAIRLEPTPGFVASASQNGHRSSFEAVVVGAGQAGVAASNELRARGIEHVVFERGRVGETWRSQRWDSFVLNTPVWMNRLPGSSSPGTDPTSFPTGREFAEDLERYVRSRELPVQEGVTVLAVERAQDGYVITTSAGCYRSKRVVVASGAQRTPKIPALAAGLSDTIEQLHVAHYSSPEKLPAGGVLVVGGGQSGCQIAEELLEAGRRVYIATSRVGRLPRRYRGRDTLEWRVEMGFYDRTPDVATDLEPVGAPIPLTTGVRGGHTLSLQQLARDGAILLGRLTEASGSRLRFADDLAENVRFGDNFAEDVRRSIDGYIRCARIDAPPAEADPLEAPEPCLGVAPPRDLDLRSTGVGTVLWATGFSGDFRWLPRSILDRNGRPAHDNGIGRSPGLYVIGLPWLSKRKSGIVYGVGEDADRIAGHLTQSRDRRRLSVQTAAH